MALHCHNLSTERASQSLPNGRVIENILCTQRSLSRPFACRSESKRTTKRRHASISGIAVVEDFTWLTACLITSLIFKKLAPSRLNALAILIHNLDQVVT